MFYGRPVLPQLGIDLVSVAGGGRSPSQFFGRTSDDRPIYIRYRAAWLKILVGPVGAAKEDATELLLEARIGPPLHGFILLEQVCDLCGITLHGRPPRLSEKEIREIREHHPVFDFSGKTLYWERNVWLVAEDCARLFAALLSISPDMTIIRTTWVKEESGPRGFVPKFEVLESFGDADGRAHLSFGVNRRRLKKLLSDAKHTRSELDRVARHNAYVQIDWPKPGRRRVFGAHLRDPQPTTPAIETATERVPGYLRFTFSPDDKNAQDFMRKFVGVADALFRNQYDVVDVETGAFLERRELGRWYSMSLQDWSAAAPNRFLSTTRDERYGNKIVGYRPIGGFQ